MQLVAYGAQDIYLTGNPLITFFKVVYRRHTNFAIESIENTFNNSPSFGGKSTALIQRNGDLLSKVYIQAVLPDIGEKRLQDFGIGNNGYTLPNRRFTRWIDNIGHYLLKMVEIEIGGQLIDRHYSDWLEIWAQLTVPASQVEGYREMIGQDPLNVLGQNTGLQADVFKTNNTTNFVSGSNFPTYTSTSNNLLVGREIYVPLQFWFCRDYGMSLPLIALQHHEVKINIEFRTAHELIMTYNGDEVNSDWITSNNHNSLVDHGAIDITLWADFIYLDTDERRKFAQVSHEYLIEQVQFNNISSLSGTDKRPAINNVDLYFDNPVKELVWIVKAFDNNREWSNYTNTQVNNLPPFSTASVIQETNGNPNIPVEGLTGLPSGILNPIMFDIDVNYSIFGTIANGTEITVTNNENNISNTSIYFVINDNTLLKPGDLVILSGTNNLPLMVTDINNTGHPVKFRLRSQASTALYVEVSLIDRLGANVVTNETGITNMSNYGLNHIITNQNLVDMTSFNGTRPANKYGLATNPIKEAKLQLNNYDRFDTMPGMYFNQYQPYKYHTNIPTSPGINVYSFAIKPEELQPSGTCNFSRIDKVRLILSIGSLYYGGSLGDKMEAGQNVEVRVFAVNYNVLRIMAGMAGLAYTSG